MRSIATLVLLTGALVLAATPAQASGGAVKPKPKILTILVGKHGVAGGPKKFTVKRGTRVVLRVRSQIGEAVHLHGYDIEKPIKNTKTFVRIRFVAKIRGVFELELHLTETRGLRIALLTVK
jgi:hypothetical protein